MTLQVSSSVPACSGATCGSIEGINGDTFKILVKEFNGEHINNYGSTTVHSKIQDGGREQNDDADPVQHKNHRVRA
jgi:hypothetical protein